MSNPFNQHNSSILLWEAFKTYYKAYAFGNFFIIDIQLVHGLLVANTDNIFEVDLSLSSESSLKICVGSTDICIMPNGVS